jgi:hypothetical protein
MWTPVQCRYQGHQCSRNKHTFKDATFFREDTADNLCRAVVQHAGSVVDDRFEKSWYDIAATFCIKQPLYDKGPLIALKPATDQLSCGLKCTAETFVPGLPDSAR